MVNVTNGKPPSPSNGEAIHFTAGGGNSDVHNGGVAPPHVGQPCMPYTGDFDSVRSSDADFQRQLSLKKVVSLAGVRATCDDWRPNYRPLINRINDRVQRGEKFFSLEFFPPRTEQALANFYHRLDRLNEGGPLFVDVTWHMGSDPGSDKPTSSSTVAAGCLNFNLIDTMLHITCAQYEKEQTLRHLERAKALGIRNLLALRGDVPGETDLTKLKYASVDLVRWIREEHGDYFTVAVAGYPKGHPDAKSYTADLENLKAKCDAGADLVVTQLFFEAETFLQFVRDCREIGIDKPIVPGIMPIFAYDNIVRIAELSKLEIPQFILDAITPIKEDSEAVQNFGIAHCVRVCRELLASDLCPSLHMYTLNREAAPRQILQQVGLWRRDAVPRALPWKQQTNTAHPIRTQEDVRPIFWSARPKSYIYRTKDWEGYPNGRWGAVESPAFADMQNYYLFYNRDQLSRENKLKMWGDSITSPEQAWRVFTNFVSGESNDAGVKITRLPWSEQDLSSETALVRDELVRVSKYGVCSINSQPNVNGAPSSDPLVGWGPNNGYCYQKAYIEFFANRKLVNALLSILPNYGHRINYHIVNKDGTLDCQSTDKVTAVTWGVFPSSEIAQPTVVDPVAFRAWRDEAYDLWQRQWIDLYDADSESRKTLQKMHDSYCLVNLVDEDFQKQSILFMLLDEAHALCNLI